jgi:ribonuclease VapC
LRNFVLDSYALLAYLFGEEGHEKVVTLLERAADSGRNALIASPNWAEVCYQVRRKAGPARWAEIREKLLGLPIEIVPADQELAEAAGAIKAERKMSLADCFAAALALERKAEVVTGDPEFREVEDRLRVTWL